jgi:hypothetical protein
VTQLTIPNPQDLQGRTLFDASGEGIGTIEGVYLDNVTRRPEWAAVRLGPDALALVPLAEASLAGGRVQVDYDRAMVLSAPHALSGLDSEVTEETEETLYRYYATGYGNGSSSNGRAHEVKEAAAEVKDQAAGAVDEVAGEAADVADRAKAEAAEVVASAKDHAASVVEVAKEETVEIAHQASAEARELIETTKTELQEQAEAQLGQLAETLHRLAGQALALARGNAEQAGPVGDLVARAGEELQSVAMGIDAKGSPGLLEDAQRLVRQRPRAAIIGTAAAVVAGAKLMGTPAGERLKERLAPLKEQAIEAGRSVAEEMKPVAQQRVGQVKAVASQAAEQVKQEAQGTAEDVKSTATEAGKTVKGTARRSATEVKGRARQSSATTKTTARQAATTARATAVPGPQATARRTPARRSTTPRAAAQTAAGRPAASAARPPATRSSRPRVPVV